MTRHEDADPRRPRRRMRWGPAACLAALALLALPSLAAAKCTPIPGRSALDQYCESVPGAGGDRPTPAAASTAAPAAALRCRRAWPATWPPPRRGRALLDFLENSGPTASANTTPNQTETNRGDAGSPTPTAPRPTAPTTPSAPSRTPPAPAPAPAPPTSGY